MVKDILVDKEALSRFLGHIRNLLSPINDKIDKKVNLPMDENGNVLNGEVGDLLMSKEAGLTEWTSELVTTEDIDIICNTAIEIATINGEVRF